LGICLIERTDLFGGGGGANLPAAGRQSAARLDQPQILKSAARTQRIITTPKEPGEQMFSGNPLAGTDEASAGF
jgi:hypothetical protein